MSLACREYITCDGPGCTKHAPPKRCARCKLFFYCSVDCQKEHWKAGHKRNCKDTTELREDIVGLPCEKNLSDQSAFEEQKCYICHSEQIVDPFTVAKCQHVFCFRCLSDWQGRAKRFVGRTRNRKNPKPICPACYNSLPNEEGTVPTRSLLYAKRANRVGLPLEERNGLRQKALEALEDLGNVKQGNCCIEALFLQAATLMELEKPDDAENVFQKLLEIHREGIETRNEVRGMLAEGREALTNGKVDEAKETLAKCKTFSNESRSRVLDPEEVFDVYLGLAEAIEQRKAWKDASEVYDFIASALNRIGDSDGTHAVQVLIGKACCAFHLTQYEQSIQAGTEAIGVDRTFPNVHRYVALSQEAMGDLEACKVALSRAVNYEASWDEEHKKTMLLMYEQRLAAT
eukprot:scaffold2315_cov113-Cylindrotheca_fusiformis.AAC.15